MTNQDLNELVISATQELMVNSPFLKDCQNQLAEQVHAILLKKHDEYALDSDALSNFKNGGKIFGDVPEKVLLYYKLKHDVSIKKLVEDLPKMDLMLFKEKIVDNIAYLVLLWAHLVERSK